MHLSSHTHTLTYTLLHTFTHSRCDNNAFNHTRTHTRARIVRCFRLTFFRCACVYVWEESEREVYTCTVCVDVSAFQRCSTSHALLLTHSHSLTLSLSLYLSISTQVVIPEVAVQGLLVVVLIVSLEWTSALLQSPLLVWNLLRYSVRQPRVHV